MRPGKGEAGKRRGKANGREKARARGIPSTDKQGNGTDGEGGKRRAASKREGDKHEGNGA